MHTPPAPALPSELRLTRLHKWLSLWLVWFVAHVLAHIAPQGAAASLAQARRRTRILLLVHAMRRVTPPPLLRKARCYDPARTCRDLTARVFVGHALNRALRVRDPMAQARRLQAILADPERWIARIVRRLNRRYSKLRLAPRFPRSTPLTSVARPRAIILNSS